jgi:hypothetical protein
VINEIWRAGIQDRIQSDRIQDRIQSDRIRDVIRGGGQYWRLNGESLDGRLDDRFDRDCRCFDSDACPNHPHFEFDKQIGQLLLQPIYVTPRNLKELARRWKRPFKLDTKPSKLAISQTNL